MRQTMNNSDKPNDIGMTYLDNITTFQKAKKPDISISYYRAMSCCACFPKPERIRTIEILKDEPYDP